MIYLIPVPIGNHLDISLRALELIKEVDILACEDTRTSALLLSNYQIKRSLISYHEHNEEERTKYLIEEAKQGKSIGLISDAGMPGISDPGYLLVKRAIEEDLDFTVLPGANAALTALVASGLDSSTFVFFGFLATKGSSRQEKLKQISQEARTIILYESPHRVEKLILDLIKLGLAQRRVVFARELTKKYEEYIRLNFKEARDYFAQKSPKGEFVVIVEGKREFEKRLGSKKDLDLAKMLKESFKEQSLSRAVKLVAAQTALPKSQVYALALELLEDED